MEMDRLSIDKKRNKEIRGIKSSSQLEFGNQRDVFLYALVLGPSIYNGESIKGARDGLFNSRDLSALDEAIIYSIVYDEFDSIDELADTNLVYKKAEDIADKGFDIVFEEFNDDKEDIFFKKKIKENDELYEKAKREGLFDI